MAHNWLHIAKNLKKGRTILILGPNAIPFYATGNAQAPEMPLSQLTHQAILTELGETLPHYHAADQLFLFKSMAMKQTAMESIEETLSAREWLPDADLLRKLVAVPFPLILNLNPDKFLVKAFAQYAQTVSFDYLSTKYKPASPSPPHPPTCEQPMIYNLCGSTEDALDSVILDRYDLAQLLAQLFDKIGIPAEIRSCLQKANHFLLLGFPLDSWYLQVFLHFLNQLDGAFDDKNHNYPIYSPVSPTNKDFVMKQFNIQHFADARSDFEHLFRACEQLQILRPLHDDASPAEIQIRQLVAQKQFEQAFDLLQNQYAALDPDALTILQSRYAGWRESKQRKTASFQDLEVEINRIAYAILTYAGQIQDA